MVLTRRGLIEGFLTTVSRHSVMWSMKTGERLCCGTKVRSMYMRTSLNTAAKVVWSFHCLTISPINPVPSCELGLQRNLKGTVLGRSEGWEDSGQQRHLQNAFARFEEP